MTVIDGSNGIVSHLGLISGIIDELRIVETIDKYLPKKRNHTVSHGTAVKALLLNCLGFVERRLYVMPDYFEDIATERLLGPEIKPEHLNQYLFGETFNRIAEFGPTNLFNLIILVILNFVNLGILRIHSEMTTISVTGVYDSDFYTKLIRLIHDHSKEIAMISSSLSLRYPRINEEFRFTWRPSQEIIRSAHIQKGLHSDFLQHPPHGLHLNFLISKQLLRHLLSHDEELTVMQPQSSITSTALPNVPESD